MEGRIETLEITVNGYFTKQCNIELKYYAYMPCLDVGRPKRTSYLPLELCSLVSLQCYTKALSSVQRASLIEKSRQKPRERIRVVTDAVKNYGYGDDPLLATCGISIEKQITQVDGRVLEAPKGTSRPAHYHVLLDETSLSPVAPICYAHLAATQMGQFIKFEDFSETSSGHKSLASHNSRKCYCCS